MGPNGTARRSPSKVTSSSSAPTARHQRVEIWHYDPGSGGWGTAVELLTSLPSGWPTDAGDWLEFDGDTIAVGIPTAAGSARLFKRTSTSWTPIAPDSTSASPGADEFGSAIALGGDTVVVGDPADSPGTLGGSVTTLDVPFLDPSLEFDLELAAGAPAAVNVAPNGIAVNQIDRADVAARGATSNVAASSITTIGVEDAALAQIAIGSTPLARIVLESAPLSAIPLTEIDLKTVGGWPKLLTDAGSELAEYPMSTITFGEVLSQDDPQRSDDLTDRIKALPLSAIDVDGTPLAAIPLAAIALGSTPLSAIPLEAVGDTGTNPWCAIVEDLIPAGQTCEQALASLTVMEVTLRGVPLGRIPLGRIPLSAIDLSQSPLATIPLGRIELEKSPLGRIPLAGSRWGGSTSKAARCRTTPLGRIPLGADPVGGGPVGADRRRWHPAVGDPVGADPVGADRRRGPVGRGQSAGADPLGPDPAGPDPVGPDPTRCHAVVGASRWGGSRCPRSR